MPRLIAIGDIHGCGKELQQLLTSIAPQPDDTFVFLGDYLDRGLTVPWVIEQIMLLVGKVQRVVTLRGNHEEWLLEAREEPRAIGWIEAGGWATVEAYHPATLEEIRRVAKDVFLPHRVVLPLEKFWAALPIAHLQFIEKTVLYHRQDGFVFVHAGLESEKPIEEQSRYVLLNNTEALFKNGGYRNFETVVFGHISTMQLRPDGQPLPYLPDTPNVIGLDTSACQTGILTAMDLLSGEIWQTSPEDAFQEKP